MHFLLVTFSTSRLNDSLMYAVMNKKNPLVLFILSFLPRMAAAPPSYCFVAFPPCSKDGLVVFGKNSARPRDEVQEVVYFAAAEHEPGSKVEVRVNCCIQTVRNHCYWKKLEEMNTLLFSHQIVESLLTSLKSLE